jgi:hypothetical protein
MLIFEFPFFINFSTKNYVVFDSMFFVERFDFID